MILGIFVIFAVVFFTGLCIDKMQQKNRDLDQVDVEVPCWGDED